MPLAAANASLKNVLRRPPVVVALLSVMTVLAFVATSHLVYRFREQEKALARHLYAQGKTEYDSGNPAAAVTYFRAALSYQRDDSQYQLDLARALRETGKTDEAKAYLLRLWEGSPNDGAINLALARLAVRLGSTDEAIHYFHNATYGIWNSDPETNRRNAQLELIDFLEKQNARPQAEAELIMLSASLPRDPGSHMQVAEKFALAGDYSHALAEYQSVTLHDRANVKAQAGAGEAAFQMHRYGTAEKYLSETAKLDPDNQRVQQSLKMARLVIQADPFVHRIASTERNRRVRAAFDRVGERLNNCGSSLPDHAGQKELPAELLPLRQSWLDLKPVLASAKPIESDQVEHVMDLVFNIQQQTKTCADATDIDQALLLLEQDREGADR